MNAEKVINEERNIIPPVNCKNDLLMVREGIYPPPYYQDPEWHYKTPEEHKELAKFTKIKGLRPSSTTNKKKELLKFRIVVHLKNLKKDPEMKTTYSDMLYFSQIPEWLNINFGKMIGEVKHIYYNGKPFEWGPVSK